MLFGDAAVESKRLSLDLFEKMLDCLDKYVGRKKFEPNVVCFRCLLFYNTIMNANMNVVMRRIKWNLSSSKSFSLIAWMLVKSANTFLTIGRKSERSWANLYYVDSGR